MSISRNDAKILKAAHFSRDEIKAIKSALTPEGTPQPKIEITNDAWKFAIRSRKIWYGKMKKAGNSEKQIQAEIRKYYTQRKNASPFDFLEGYKQGRSKTKITTQRMNI
jgi:hypothetical protein